ncbi:MULTISPECIES: hypothetical protein [Streptomyces]|uniref:hypothetical protein n=1 Tax=Streptomyces TaxID=1883 RepID=UPI00131BD066|nr:MULTISPECIES: hypothetical protein [Streptomyces]
MDSDYSTLFEVFRRTGVVEREAFRLATFAPCTGAKTGGIDAHDFAHEVLRALRRCRDKGGYCLRCDDAARSDWEHADLWEAGPGATAPPK